MKHVQVIRQVAIRHATRVMIAPTKHKPETAVMIQDKQLQVIHPARRAARASNPMQVKQTQARIVRQMQVRQMAVIRQIVIMEHGIQQSTAQITNPTIKAVTHEHKIQVVSTREHGAQQHIAQIQAAPHKHKIQVVSIHQAGKDTIPLMGIHIIPSMKTIIPIIRAGQHEKNARKNGSNPAMNALSINPSEQIHATYSGARRSVIGRIRIPIMIQASISNNVKRNPGHAINIPITRKDSSHCIAPQHRANITVMSRSA